MPMEYLDIFNCCCCALYFFLWVPPVNCEISIVLPGMLQVIQPIPSFQFYILGKTFMSKICVIKYGATSFYP
jgi:hypothetical protein